MSNLCLIYIIFPRLSTLCQIYQKRVITRKKTSKDLARKPLGVVGVAGSNPVVPRLTERVLRNHTLFNFYLPTDSRRVDCFVSLVGLNITIMKKAVPVWVAAFKRNLYCYFLISQHLGNYLKGYPMPV